MSIEDVRARFREMEIAASHRGIVAPPPSWRDVGILLRALEGNYVVKAEGRKLVQQARAATGPAVEHMRSATETWFWEHTAELLGPFPSEPHK